FLVVLAIISLVIYSLASCGTLFYFYKTTYKVVFNKNAKVVEEVNEKATEAQEEVIYEKGEPIYNRDFVKVILERMEKAGEKLQETEVDEALEKVREEKQFNRIVKIAVRPEAFEVDKSGFVSVDVSNIEHIGRDVSVVGHVSKQNNKVRILIPSELSNQLTSNQLHFSPKKYYVFETSGKRLK
ncbi:MAG: hypothetical protein J1F31_05995, partial [Erysipelotrichales bacterium]|nr:hypothetical protein [Erysipelotrichales bacterium]